MLYQVYPSALWTSYDVPVIIRPCTFRGDEAIYEDNSKYYLAQILPLVARGHSYENDTNTMKAA